MSDQPNATSSPAEPTTLKRVFKIGSNRIAEDAATSRLSNEQVRVLLKAQYPEIANATIRETMNGDTKIIEYLAVGGRKG